jgi:hypothetical protein
MEEEFHEADQIATVPTSVAIKQVLGSIDIEGRARFRMQGTETHKLCRAL